LRICHGGVSWERTAEGIRRGGQGATGCFAHRKCGRSLPEPLLLPSVPMDTVPRVCRLAPGQRQLCPRGGAGRWWRTRGSARPRPRPRHPPSARSRARRVAHHHAPGRGTRRAKNAQSTGRSRMTGVSLVGRMASLARPSAPVPAAPRASVVARGFSGKNWRTEGEKYGVEQLSQGRSERGEKMRWPAPP